MFGSDGKEDDWFFLRNTRNSLGTLKSGQNPLPAETRALGSGDSDRGRPTEAEQGE
jgi:hypothetical protein